METPDQPLSNADSLQLIQQMIRAAKQDLSDNSFDFLFWGWLVLVAALSNYVLLRLDYANPALPWLLMPMGGLVVGVYHWRKKGSQLGPTPLGVTITFLWISFGVLLAFTLGVGAKFGQEVAYPLIIALYGLGAFTTGGALRFRPLIFGGATCWLLATLAFQVDFPTQLLLVAVALVISYIIPGHLLKAQYRRARPV